MAADVDRRHKVPCFGHIFKAVFILSLITIIVNVVHIIMAIRHKDYIQIPAHGISILCYLFVIVAQILWRHHFFYPEFYLNVVALPVKIILAVWLLFNSFDVLETAVEDLYPNLEVRKDIIHIVRACLVLVGVILELYVFRLCQKAHHLMRHLPEEEGRRQFSVRRFVRAESIVKDVEMRKSEGQPNRPNMEIVNENV